MLKPWEYLFETHILARGGFITAAGRSLLWKEQELVIKPRLKAVMIMK